MNLIVNNEKDKEILSSNELEDNFRLGVQSLKELLLEIVNECSKHEKEMSFDEKVTIVRSLQEGYFPKINNYFTDLTKISLKFDKKTYELHKNYLRKNIYTLITNNDAPLNKQICEKPLGYAGDYIVTNYFYDDGYPGNSIYGMFIDRYTLEAPLARAHINRRTYLRNVILKLKRRKINNPLNISSFACGPAPEVFDILDNGVKDIYFNLIDGEKKVIEYLKDKTEKYNNSFSNVNLIHANIFNFIRGKKCLNIPEQDLIYSAGFLDYIKKSTATRFLKTLLNYLKPRGILIVTNASIDDSNNAYLKMIGEWDMYHRTCSDLLNLVEGMDNIQYKKVLSDFYTKRNLYLIIKKK